MRASKIYTSILLVTAVLFIGGCFEFEERMVLKKDGSGTLEVEYWTMEDVNINGDGYEFPEKEADIRDEVIEKYTSDNVKLMDFKVYYQEDSRHVRFTVKFDNVDDLNDLKQFHENKIRFKRDGHRIDFERTVFIDNDDNNLDDEPNNTFEKFVVGLVKEGLSNIKFRFELELPYEINDSNADWISGKHRAVWKYRLSDVINKDDIVMKLKTK
ncbi:hypothetical protein JW960_07455 [candidate division KSB1 bacterium]|nr:hypothetical protein [candidate division KSB1 bacterium]